MAVIYLRHPVHGHKVATSDMEAKYDKGQGWTEFDPFEKPKPLPPIFEPVPVETEPVSTFEQVNQMIEPVKRTRKPKAE